MISPISARRLFALLFLCSFGLAAIGCAGKPKYDQANANAAKLATPPHNLSAYDYPFDDDGTYRKDWVTNKNATRGKRWQPAASKPSTPPQAPMVASNQPPQQQQRQPTYTPPPQTITPPPAPRPTPPVAAAPKPAARYHTVAKGDTLYSISRRYGATVPQIKSTNGLTSDVIRIGQTLRLP